MSIKLPSELPVMELPHTSLFPGVRLPLYIFENRYRKMLIDVIESERVFCIGTINENSASNPEEPSISPYSTAGLLRACVENTDGTSNVILEGLIRVKFVKWIHKKVYKLAQIEPIFSVTQDLIEAELLCGQIKKIVGCRIGPKDSLLQGSTIEDLWNSIGSVEAIADFVAYHCISDPNSRQQLLSMESVEERLIFTRECLLR